MGSCLRLGMCGLLLMTAANRSARGEEKGVKVDRPVAATVNGEPIYVDEVRDSVERAVGGEQLGADELTKAQSAALGQMIDRQLVEAVVVKAGCLARAPQIDAALTQIRLQREQQKIAWPDYLKQRGMNEAAFRRQLGWQLSWDKYLQARLTDAMLENYFKARQAEFDGTLVRVSHLLLGPLPSDPQAAADLVEKAGRLRAEINSGTLTFEDAAKAHSTGPSRQQGGDLGFMPRHGLMVEAFSRAAFQLKPGEISPPVTTPFGVHLIKAVEVKPGGKKWNEVRDQLKPAAAQALFQALAEQERKTAKIALSGTMVPLYGRTAP